MRSSGYEQFDDVQEQEHYVDPRPFSLTRCLHRYKIFYPLIGISWIITAALLIYILNPSSSVTPLPDDAIVEFAIFAFNDCYELKPLSGLGGLARVATFQKQLQKEYPNGVVTVFPGDFFSPSAVSSAVVQVDESKSPARLDGRQMVDVFNALNVDVVTFGNHEFDLHEASFRERLLESNFTYVATNVRDARTGKLFTEARHVTSMFMDVRGVRLGFVGVVLSDNTGEYEQIADIDDYHEAMLAVRAELAAWRARGERWDVTVALTHLPLEHDLRLASDIPQLDIIIGGHEHQNWYVNRGTPHHDLPIAKADANARTVFTHRMRFDTRVARAVGVDQQGTAFNAPGALKITSELSVVDEELAEDPSVAARVAKWWDLAAAGFRKAGIDPDKPMARLPLSLDARESVVRNEASVFGALVAQAFYNATLAEAPVAHPPSFFFFNSGSIRVDDVLGPGLLNEYDVLRVLPFSGSLRLARARGEVLVRALESGVKAPGSGAWPAYDPEALWRYKGVWWMRGEDEDVMLAEQDEVVFGTTDYVIGGGDDYFVKNSTDVVVIQEEFSRNIVEVLRDALHTLYPIEEE